MNISALPTVSVLAAAVMAVTACAAPDSGEQGRGPGEPGPTLIGPVWVVEDINGGGIVEESEVTMSFREDGSVAGRGSCNAYAADYERTGNALGIGRATSTEMACAAQLMAQEQRFFDALGATARYHIDERGALVLRASEGRSIRARRG